MMKKSWLALLLMCCLLLAACGQAAAPAQESAPAPAEGPAAAEEPTPEPAGTRAFTDSTGRTVTVPARITRIAVSGPLTQTYILPLGIDLMVGVSNAYASEVKKYLPETLLELPEIGQLYGGKGELDLEALLAAAPEVVIDIGETKSGMKEDLDALTEQTGIPFVHVEATVSTAAAAYRTLGDLLGREEQAEELAAWCEGTLQAIDEMMAKVDADGARKSLLYCLGDTGTNVMAQGSFHADTINIMSDNLAVIDDVTSSGAGNESDLEQIMVWDPEVIIFDYSSIYDQVPELPQWQAVSAVAQGHYYRTPYGPYGWLSSPPSVQRYLGLLWLGDLLYPEYVPYDLQEEVTEYYRLFYGCELTDEMYAELMQGAL